LLRDLHTQPDPTSFSSQYRVDEKLRGLGVKALDSLAAAAPFARSSA
jgi:hypothetical protein